MNAHYRKLLEMTCQIAHVLKSKEVKKGDVVLIYMPSSPIAVAAMLACTRIGAVHWYVFVSSYSRPLLIQIAWDLSPFWTGESYSCYYVGCGYCAVVASEFATLRAATFSRN